jgi:hypothetical protein
LFLSEQILVSTPGLCEKRPPNEARQTVGYRLPSGEEFELLGDFTPPRETKTNQKSFIVGELRMSTFKAGIQRRLFGQQVLGGGPANLLTAYGGHATRGGQRLEGSPARRAEHENHLASQDKRANAQARTA